MYSTEYGTVQRKCKGDDALLVNHENASIRNKMNRLGLSITSLATYCGVSANTLGHWIISPMTEKHKAIVLQGLAKAEADKKGGGID